MKRIYLQIIFDRLNTDGTELDINGYECCNVVMVKRKKYVGLFSFI